MEVTSTEDTTYTNQKKSRISKNISVSSSPFPLVYFRDITDVRKNAKSAEGSFKFDINIIYYLSIL